MEMSHRIIGSMKRAMEAMDKDSNKWSTDDVAEILLAADELRKDSVLMKEVNILMRKKQAQMEKITSFEQLKEAALEVSKRDDGEAENY